MRWADFDWHILLHIIAIAVGTVLTLAGAYGAGASGNRKLCLLLERGAFWGVIIFAMMFDGSWLIPFSWQSLGLIMCGVCLASVLIDRLITKE